MVKGRFKPFHSRNRFSRAGGGRGVQSARFLREWDEKTSRFVKAVFIPFRSRNLKPESVERVYGP